MVLVFFNVTYYYFIFPEFFNFYLIFFGLVWLKYSFNSFRFMFFFSFESVSCLHLGVLREEMMYLRVQYTSKTFWNGEYYTLSFEFWMSSIKIRNKESVYRQMFKDVYNIREWNIMMMSGLKNSNEYNIYCQRFCSV